MTNGVATRPAARLRKPAHMSVDDDTWNILCTSTFPTALDPNSIALVWSLCKVRGLDIFRRPYHIVKMWNAAAGREVEQVIQGINELLVVASRTKEFAGVDPPIFGQTITETFKGRKRDRERAWVDAAVTVSYPETISITVYRMIDGVRCPFAMPIRWKEEYARVGGSALPNEMWARRVFDQGQKVALAASLRVAFPDVVGDEDEDLSIAPQPTEAITTEDPQLPPPERLQPKPPDPPVDPATGEIGSPHAVAPEQGEALGDWCARALAGFDAANSEAELDQWLQANQKLTDAIAREGSELFKSRWAARINKIRNDINLKQGGSDGSSRTDQQDPSP